MSKGSAVILLAVLIISIIITSGFVCASTAKPSAPEFTLKYVDNSYDVPPIATSTIDPYTGKTITTTTPGYRIEDKSIEITVTNQPFTPYSDTDGHLISLFYNVRYKGHFGAETTWTEPFYKTIRNGIYGFTAQNPQSNSGYTIINVPFEFRVGDVVDFQVQRMEGFHTPWEPLPMPMGTSQFTGIYGDWSNTQTITIGEAINSNKPSPTSTLSPTPTQQPFVSPSVPEFSWFVIVPLFLSVFFIIVIFRHRKTDSLK